MIGDIASNVVVSFKADTTDLKKGLKDLQGEEKKLAEAQLKAAEERNKHLEQWKTGLVAVGAAIGVAGGIAKFMWDDYKERAEEARLKTAAFGVDLDLLSKAALGTKNQMELLGEAAKMNNGIFKLTSEQMMIVERAMIGFGRQGRDMADVQRIVMEAVTELKTKGLDDLGIVLDQTGLNLDNAADRFTLLGRIMDSFKDVAVGVKDTHRTMAEEVEHAAARMSDSWKKFKNDWITGNMVKIAGVDVDVTAYIMDAQYARAARSHMFKNAGAAAASGKSPEQYQADMDAALAAQGKMTQQAGAFASQYPKFGHELDMPSMNLGAERDKIRAEARKRKAAYDKMWNDAYAELIAEGAKVAGGRDSDSGFFHAEDAADINANYAQPEIGAGLFGKYGPGGAHDEQAYNQYQGAKNQSMLEGIFGPLQDFDAYATAFQTLNGALGSAFSAWIDGSQSAGKAFKAFIAEALKGVAVQMAMEAVKHAAYGLGALAFGPIGGVTAAAHFKAAAAFSAGAVVVGAAAKGLHSGGGSSPGASAPGGGVPAYSGGGQQSGSAQTVVIAYGPEFSQDSARQRQLRAARIVEDARQAAPNSGVSYA